MRRTSVPKLQTLSAFFLLACSSHRNETQEYAAGTKPPVHADLVRVEEQQVPQFLTLTGSLKADRQSDVAADASGKVTATFVERGQRVHQGDLLISLDTRSAALGATAAKAQSELARSQLELAKEECERGKRLWASGSINRADFDRTQTQCSNSQFSLAVAQANSEAAAKTVRDANIRAPFTGVVGERFVSVGQYVHPDTRVVSVYSINPLRAELTAPENAVPLIHQDMPLSFQVSAYGNEIFTGSVRYISPALRATTRDLVLEAIVPNLDNRLRAGMFAVVKMKTGEALSPVVPETAVKREGDDSRIFAVVEGKVQERLVQVAEAPKGFVAILKGASKGEMIVNKPDDHIHDGVRVE